ncbi:hypothetical protein, partial [Klebsiella michiganensis]|uniref:hypothetical protein n=1 Tax=Klebsiella michiganensis TaxID=1134687 RepID=UPI001D0F1FF4
MMVLPKQNTLSAYRYRVGVTISLSPEGNVITHALHPFSWTLKLESPMSRRKYTFEQRLEVVMHY